MSGALRAAWGLTTGRAERDAARGTAPKEGPTP
jgi:hypothetical protein